MIRRRLVVAVAFVVALSACSGGDAEDLSFQVDPLAAQPISQSSAVGRSVADVALPDVANDGRPFLMRAQAGEVLVVYFGFTSCPDICPTTLADLREALTIMGPQADAVTVAMVTIDPERDADSTVEAYVRSFIPDAAPLRTDDAQVLAEVAEAFDASFDVITTASGAVEVYHTAYLYAIDDEGVIQRIWPFGAEPEQIADDLGALLEGA